MQSGDYEYQSDFARKYVAQGRAEGRQEGEAQAILEVLAARELEVDTESRHRIMACKEPDQLKSWLRRAVTVQSVHGLFESASPTKARGRRQTRKPSRK